MSAFLATRGMGGSVVASGGMGPGYFSVTPTTADDWNIVATEIREKDQPTSILMGRTGISKYTP